MFQAGEIKGSGPGNIFEKSTVFSPNTSGYLQCHGENEHGSHSDTLLIKMSGKYFILRFYLYTHTHTHTCSRYYM